MRRLAFVALLVPFALTIAAPVAQAGGFCTMEPLTDRAQSTVDMKENCFFPMVVRVDKGETVTWENFDATAHSVTAPGGWGGGHKEFLKGDKVSFKFNEDGVYPYLCLYHPGMVGAVVVGDGEGHRSGLANVGEADASTGTGSTEAAGDSPVATTVPSGAGEDEGVSVFLLMVLMALAVTAILIVGAWVRRRFATRGSDAVA